MNSTTTDHSCILCGLALPLKTIREGTAAFCCAGCQAVYNILKSKQEDFSNIHSHPLFQQAMRTGLISNPALLEQLQTKEKREDDKESRTEKLWLQIEGMWCPSCAVIVTLLLLKQKGISQATIDYTTDMAAIHYDPKSLGKEQITALIESLGYGGVGLSDNVDEKKRHSSLMLRLAVASFCSLNVMMLAYPLYATYFDDSAEDYGRLFAWLSLPASLPVVSYCAWPIWRRFYNGIKARMMATETLVFMGVWSAFFLSLYNLANGGSEVYFDSLTAIIALMLAGKVIEAKAKVSSKEAVLTLVKMAPKRGRKCFSDGTMRFVPLKEIEVGDNIAAFTGERIILDGIVVKGEASCHEAVMTGEFIPVLKGEGDSVIGGAVVDSGAIVYRATSGWEASTLQKIFLLAEGSLENKALYHRAADAIVKWFAPLILLLVLLNFCRLTFFEGLSMVDALLQNVALMLIACPCAIGIAAPLSEAFLMQKLATLGALVRNRGALSLLAGGKLTFAFDKTGTLTGGDYKVLNDLEKSPQLKGLASLSLHPVARAIDKALDGVKAITPDSHVEVAGKGMRGVFGEEILLLGSEAWMHDNGVNVADSSDGDSNVDGDGVIASTAFFAVNGTPATPILLGDTIKEEAKKAIDALKAEKHRCLLLSGDGEEAVGAVAKALGIDSYSAGCSPERKQAIVTERRLKGGDVVVMVGDGINDAPALAAADVGISVVAATDLSAGVSDIILAHDRLSILPEMVIWAQCGSRVIAQNLFWAFFYNGVGVALALTGALTPLYAAFAMTASSLIVIANAHRIR